MFTVTGLVITEVFVTSCLTKSQSQPLKLNTLVSVKFILVMKDVLVGF